MAARKIQKKPKSTFGSVRQLPSGRFQANYTGPDRLIYKAPQTFDTRGDADAWVSEQRRDISKREWVAPGPAPAALLLGDYSARWMQDRKLAVKTRDLYAGYLKNHILPTFGGVPLKAITSPDVRTWYAELGVRTGPRAQSGSYAFLSTIFNTAVSDDLISSSPCRIRGAGQNKRVKKIRPATLPELEVIVTSIAPKYQLIVLFAAWCAMRFGELTELRRGDIDVANGVIRVRRGVVNTAEQGRLVKDPKSEAGKRDIHIPPHLMPAVTAHLKEHAAWGRDGLLFPTRSGGHLPEPTLRKAWNPARAKAGRSDLTLHELRHTGAVLAAAEGATLAQLMARLGHSTVGAAMRYQHASSDEDRAIADRLSARATGATVTPIRREG